MTKLFFFFMFAVLITHKTLSALDLKSVDEGNSFLEENLMSYIDDFITLPKGGTPWKIFGETDMNEYEIVDDEGNEWMGLRPKFKDKLKKLNSKEILIQGYMFPLEQSDKQSLFLLGPFPLSCPYHPHTSSNLLIEVHSKKPILFSYEPINIRGRLELVPKDDEYNIFYRLKEAEVSD
tara:strand:- start:774 stop:1307 length:534 start_codon:yes stop_codon:yes gene_type:complete